MQQGEQDIWILRACLGHRILKNLVSGYAACLFLLKFNDDIFAYAIFYLFIYLLFSLQLVNLISLRPSDRLDMLRLRDTREVSS
jgi:hypothetical protein